MAWVLVTVTALAAVSVLALAALTVRLRSRLAVVEAEVAALRTEPGLPEGHTTAASSEERLPGEYVITRVGDPVVEERGEPVTAVPVAPVAAPVFADMVLKESVVQTAALFHGLRRALAPETRNRIRFHVRQEVKRSRKQRRSELRAVRRERAARQRVAMAADDTGPEGTAA